MIETIGFLGAALLTISAIPQAIKTYKSKKADDLSISMLLSWSIGCFLMFVYVLLTSADIPLLVNYLLNTIVSVGIVVLYFKYRNN